MKKEGFVSLEKSTKNGPHQARKSTPIGEPDGSNRCHWLSRDFESLIHQCQPHGEDSFHYDLVIVGSGYGGAIAAAELAGSQHQGRPLRICILERGKEYLPGMFPSRTADLPGHLRFSTPNQSEPGGQRDGLFDLRIGNSLNTLVGNGLGGGSLINAGVMIEPLASVFDERWPSALRSDTHSDLLSTYFPAAKKRVGAADAEGDNTISRHPQHQQQPLSKHQNLRLLATDRGKQPEHFYDAAITVAMRDGPSSTGVALSACKLCGDCATGCNYNAKESLDTNLLAQARQRGADIFTGASVLSLSPSTSSDGEKGWTLNVVHTGNRKRHGQKHPLKLRAAKVILAAGSLGSTEILMRSRKAGLALSPMLGQGFSSNGDMLANVFNQNAIVNAIAQENTPPDSRHIGPTITGVLDLRHRSTPLLIEEMAVPGGLRRLYEELVTTVSSLASLQEKDETLHRHGQPPLDPWSVSADKISRTGIYAIMGDDGSQGSLELTDAEDSTPLDGEGALRVHWPDLPSHPLFEAQMDGLRERVKRSGSGGEPQGNPSWQPLPDSMQALAGGGRGPLLTVHPLGGCRMGDNATLGVVDDCGRVFDAHDASTDQVFDNLVVLDGSIVPCALGANPALTIAALSLRAVQALRTSWQWDQTDAATTSQQRPVFSEPVTLTNPKPTEIEVTERITGRATLTDAGGLPMDCVIDITLRFQPKPVLDLVHRTERKLLVNTEQEPGEPISQLRVFRHDTWQQLIHAGASDHTFTEKALLVTPVTGTLEIMGRERSSYWQRVRRGAWAWILNRGLRDMYQSAEEALRNGRQPAYLPSTSVLLKPTQWPKALQNAVKKLFKKVDEVLALASRAGEMRLFEYELQMLRPESGWSAELSGFSRERTQMAVRGQKRISYRRAGNPLRQFEDMYLDEFPGLQPLSQQPRGKQPYLRFDSRFVTHYNKPLLRVVGQQDQVTALADMASFGTYFLRGIIQQHLWSFRKPDAAPLASNRRLPGTIKGIHPPEITEIAVDQYELGMAKDDETPLPICLRLTRYPQPKPSKLPPVVMIHGYSASGNSYTHPALKPSMAEYFWHHGRDVWVLDMRSSSGMATALLPWSFEDMAFADIPVAIDHICQKTGQPKVDIIAHCMGAAMTSMSVLAPPKAGDNYYQERLQLPARINKLVMSQVGPKVVFSPENIFRAYGLSYIQQVLPKLFWSFQRSEAPSAAEMLLDRLLHGLPYPDGEFELENPIWPWAKTAFVGTRHRMDALYGRTFSLKNLSKKTLKHIDDLFGPLSMATLSQVIRFALQEGITNKHGENEFVTEERLRQRWTFPTLSIHGDENGLSDISTLGRMEATMAAAERDYRTEVLYGFGHQDSLIGIGAEANFDKVRCFLDQHQTKAVSQATRHYQLSLPFSGPLFRPIENQCLSVGLGFSSRQSKPEFVLFVPVSESATALHFWQQPADQPLAAGWLREHLTLKFAAPVRDNWLKAKLPLSTSLQNAPGILVVVLDDMGLELSDILELDDLPDNLMDVLNSPAHEAHLNPLRDYLQEHLLSDAFIGQLQQFMAQPKTSLCAALIQQPVTSTADQLQLVLGACQYPAGMLDRKPAFRSYRRLGQALDEKRSTSTARLQPSLGIFTGDQVYTDATAGLMDPTDRYGRFVDAHQRWLSQPEVKSVFRRLPVLTMLDDHEILNDWDDSLLDSPHQHLLGQGKANYINFQRPDLPAMEIPAALSQQLWYETQVNGFDLFVMDTRSERQGRGALNESGQPLNGDALIISERQREALCNWLQRTRRDDHRPRLIVSPSMLLPRRLNSTSEESLVLHSDAWDGYPASQHQLLRTIADGEHRNLMFLSGDEHLSSLVDIKLSSPSLDAPIQLYSVHSSGLYSPLPFVNSSPDDFAAEECFGVRGSQKVSCEVSSQFFPGNGYALISLYQQQGQWKAECQFDREDMECPAQELRLDAAGSSPASAQSTPSDSHYAEV